MTLHWRTRSGRPRIAGACGLACPLLLPMASEPSVKRAIAAAARVETSMRGVRVLQQHRHSAYADHMAF